QVFLQYDGVTFVGGDTTYGDGTHPITVGQPSQGTISATRAVVAAFHNPIRGCESPCTSEVELQFDALQRSVALSTGLMSAPAPNLTLRLDGLAQDRSL